MDKNNQENDDDELYTIVEPVISYCSSSSNCGVSTIISARQTRPSKKLDISFTPSVTESSFSLCNTIMLPYITTEESIETNKDNYYNYKDKNQIILIKDKTSNNTLSSNGENKENIKQKENDNLMQNCILIENFNSSNKNKSQININKLKCNNIINEEEYIDTKKENKEDGNSENESKENENNENINNENENNENENNENENNENENNENKIIEDPSDYLLRGRSVRLNDCLIKTAIMGKSDKNLKKSKKTKNRGFLHKNSKKQMKTEISLEKSRSFIEEKVVKKKRKDKIDFGFKIKTSKICHNFINQNKKNDKGNSDNYFKKVIKKMINEKNKENSGENKMKIEKSEKRKTKRNDEIKRDLNKLKNIIQNSKIKPNKSFHIKPKFTMTREQIKNIEIDNNKKDKNTTEKSLNIEKEIPKENRKKFLRKKSIFNLESEKKEIEKQTTYRKISNDKKQIFPRIIFRKIKTLKKEDDHKLIKQKLRKEKNKDKDKDKDKQKDKNNLNNSNSKKEFYTPKHSYMNKDKDKAKCKSEFILRKERSNSFDLKNSSVEDIISEKNNDYNSINKSVKNIKAKKKNKEMIDFENALQNNRRKMQFNLFSKDKFTNTEFRVSDYLKYTLNCMDLILDIDMEKQLRLKNKVNFNFPTSKKSKIKKKIALFDLDETLVHCTGDINTTKEKYQNVIEIKLPGKQEIKVGINIRPYWKQTFNLIKKHYYIVVYTASHQAYADAVLDFMDPKKKYFKYRLYRNNCSLLDVDGSKFYVKDLEILNKNYNLKDIVIVDNSVLSFAYHLHNGIPIMPYYDEDKDGSLYVVGLYLMHIYNEDDLREQNKKHINLDSFLEEAKKKKEQSFDEYEDETFESIKEIEENTNNNNNEDKKIDNQKNNDKTINVRDSIAKRISDKKVTFSIQKKRSISQLSDIFQRKRTEMFESQKLKSKSKLLNMYYEVKDESPKSEHSYIQASNILKDKAKISKHLENIGNKENNKNNNKVENDIIIEDSNNNEEIDCRSDSYVFNDQNMDNNTEEEEAILKRGLTIKEDLIDHHVKSERCKKNKDKNHKNINHKLGFIRSNFYNTFKI